MNKSLYASAVFLSITGIQGLSAQTVENLKPREISIEYNNFNKLSFDNKTINPFLIKGESLITRAGDETGSVLNENFQSWDGQNIEWLPEGWSRDHKILPTGNVGWRMYTPSSIYEEIKSTCLVVQQYTQPIDEWVITPEVRVEEGMELSFLTFPTPLYYFDDAYVDWNTSEFTEMHLVNDLKIFVTEDGGDTWTQIKSLASDFENIRGYFDLYKLTKETLYTLDLSAFAGKNIKIGFNVWGIKEGNTTMIDEVSIGYPSLNISYGRPDGSLFFGLTSSDQCMPASILTVPVYSPVKFTNTSKDIKSKFSWTYFTAEGEQTVEDERDLTVTYTTDYTDENSTRNNLYDMPVLKGVADKHATTEYSYPSFLQAGGKGEFEVYYTDSSEREVIDFGLSVLDPWIDGTATYADLSVPYFGYNQSSDWFWTNRMLNGDTDFTMDEDTYSHLESYGNLFFATDEPLVISGVHANGYGILSRETILKAEIYLIGDNWVVPEEPYATAICTGDDITIIDRFATNYILSFNFKFDQPIVMSKKLTPYYFVTISGFRDEKNVEYFSPVMSANDNPDRLGLGWIGLKNKFLGNESPKSWSSIAGIIDKYVAFYIMLNATFPWLETSTDEIFIGEDGSAILSLDSYYSADELTVEGLPSWLSVEGSGRYGETKLRFISIGEKDASATVTITAPGFKKSVKVSNIDSNGVESIIDSNGNRPVEIYTLTGVRVKGDITPGIYIFKMEDGTTVKKVIK